MMPRWCCGVQSMLLVTMVVIGQLQTMPAGQPLLTTAPHGQSAKKDPMNELLHWAIENSDPQKLKDIMAEYKEKNLTLRDVIDKDVLDAFFRTEADLMKMQIAVVSDFRNESLPEGDLQAAIEELEENLHQIDNAGNLHRMGGMQPLLDLALGDRRSDETRSLALWALGVAVQNNAPVQKELHSLGGLTRLTDQLPRCHGASSSEDASPQFCGKLLFAMSGLLKNEDSLQEEADKLGVFDWMLDVGAKHSKPAIAKKAVGLLDIVLAQNSALPLMDRLGAKRETVAATCLALVRGSSSGGEVDTDMSEKALALVNRVLSLRPIAFGPGFRQALAEASSSAQRGCEKKLGAGDELCAGLGDLAGQADRVLAAQDVSDDEL
eukprot:TRINITY_DN29474_c0_g1_i1.p1 TRINITY_DN29474_c0_g1~~TRINITY_DN29474_c0_g1_i1.p1  ORF type:complete len:379 (-),score=86.72 TRINITY_DN29474_c0_g1_i1:16-1152(-)